MLLMVELVIRPPLFPNTPLMQQAAADDRALVHQEQAPHQVDAWRPP